MLKVSPHSLRLCEASLWYSGSIVFRMFGGLLSRIRLCDMHNLHAVALAEPSAAFVSFQRYEPGFPPVKIVDSADYSLTSATRFSGKSSQIVYARHMQ